MSGKLVVDGDDSTRHRRIEIAGGLHRLDDAKALSGGQLAAGRRQFEEHHVAQLRLGEVGDADRHALAIGGEPLMGFGIAAFGHATPPCLSRFERLAQDFAGATADRPEPRSKGTFAPSASASRPRTSTATLSPTRNDGTSTIASAMGWPRKKECVPLVTAPLRPPSPLMAAP